MSEQQWTVGAVARLAGVTVRALHHYEQIGLVRPAGRSVGGYRVYGEAELDRLRQVLVFRELGFALEEIPELLGNGDVEDLLARQEDLLLAKLERLDAMLSAVRAEREAWQMGIRLSREEQLAVFGEQPVTEWAEEARERWGDSDAYRESRRRTSRYAVADWQRIREESADLEQRLADALAAGLPADGPAAMALAEEHRQAICRNFYDCPSAMHAELGRMYVSDERFRSTYEAVAPGLTEYLREAIEANAGSR